TLPISQSVAQTARPLERLVERSLRTRSDRALPRVIPHPVAGLRDAPEPQPVLAHVDVGLDLPVRRERPGGSHEPRTTLVVSDGRAHGGVPTEQVDVEAGLAHPPD